MGQRREELMNRVRSLPRLVELNEKSPIVQKAQGPRLYDVENVGFIDYLGGRGSAIVGYANQYILDAVKKALSHGIPAGMHTAQEVDLGDSLRHFLPWAESLFFCRDQEDAFRRAMLWARHRTGRDQFLMLDGGDPFDVCDLDSGAAVGRVRKVPAWNLDRIEAALVAGATKIAAMVVDPLSSADGLVPAPDGALRIIAEACHQNDVLLLMDERVAGFRVARGGMTEVAGVTPDIGVYGGALGGGFPLGVIALAERADPFEAGAWRSRERLPHMVSVAAAEAVLSILKNDTVFDRLEERSLQLATGIEALAQRFSRPLQVNRVGSVFSLFPATEPVRSHKDAEAADRDVYRRLAEALYDEGVLIPPQAGCPAFVSSAHGAKDVDESLAAFEKCFMRLHKEDLP